MTNITGSWEVVRSTKPGVTFLISFQEDDSVSTLLAPDQSSYGGYHIFDDNQLLFSLVFSSDLKPENTVTYFGFITESELTGIFVNIDAAEGQPQYGTWKATKVG